MKTFKGTKGEWRHKTDHKGLGINNDEGFYADVKTGTSVHFDVWGHRISREETEANAKLIAAAPELLEALQEIREWYEQNHEEYLGELTPICFSKGLSAINKALGE